MAVVVVPVMISQLRTLNGGYGGGRDGSRRGLCSRNRSHNRSPISSWKKGVEVQDHQTSQIGDGADGGRRLMVAVVESTPPSVTPNNNYYYIN